MPLLAAGFTKVHSYLPLAPLWCLTEENKLFRFSEQTDFCLRRIWKNSWGRYWWDFFFFFIFHMSNIWMIYVMSPVCPASQLAWQKLFTLDITCKLFNPIFFHTCHAYRHHWLLPAPLTTTILYHFHWPWPWWGSLGQHKAKPIGFIFSHTFQLSRMKIDLVMKQFKLLILTQLLSEILQGTAQGGRWRGRQRKRWEDNIKEWTGLEWNNISYDGKPRTTRSGGSWL